jgi:hypothetical protein
MTVDKAIREMIREQVASAVAPLADALAQLQGQGSVLAQLSAALGGPRRGPGRPPSILKVALPQRGARRRSRGARGCALIGCRRPARSKGYCSAHYQKLRNLERTGRLPAEWKAFAPPNSVKDVVLPRGRAGAKALAEMRTKK